MEAIETGGDTPQYSIAELRVMLKPDATPTEQTQGLLALGLSYRDLFDALDVKVSDMGFLLNETIDRIKDNLGDEPEAALLRMGFDSYQLVDGPEACLDEHAFNYNSEILERYGDPEFLARQGRRVLTDLSHLGYLLLEYEALRPHVAEWITSSSSLIGTEARPIDLIKTDPILVHAAGHGLILRHLEEQEDSLLQG